MRTVQWLPADVQAAIFPQRDIFPDKKLRSIIPAGVIWLEQEVPD
jgi:hypothetical protein